MIFDVVKKDDFFIFYNKIQGKLTWKILKESEAMNEIVKLKKEICNRKDPLERVEFWECRNLAGVYDHDIEKSLLRSRLKDNEREQFAWL